MPRPKVADDMFNDLLGTQGFSSSKRDAGPRTINAMRKEEMAKDMDPDKLKVYFLEFFSCRLDFYLWKILTIADGVDGRKAAQHPSPSLLSSYGPLGGHQVAGGWNAPARLTCRREEDVPKSLPCRPSRQAGTIRLLLIYFFLNILKCTLFFLCFV